MQISSAAKIAAIVTIGVCLAVSACNKKGEETTANGSEYSGDFPSASASAESDLGNNPPSAVANSQLPGMAPAQSASPAS